jgi:hypothetical protein
VSSSEPTLAATTARVVPLGKTMTIVSGSVPCSILIVTGVEATAAVDGDAIGFVDDCALTRGAAGLSNAAFVLSISTALVSGMLTNSTYSRTKLTTNARHSDTPIVSDESFRDPCR